MIGQPIWTAQRNFMSTIEAAEADIADAAAYFAEIDGEEPPLLTDDELERLIAEYDEFHADEELDDSVEFVAGLLFDVPAWDDEHPF